MSTCDEPKSSHSVIAMEPTNTSQQKVVRPFKLGFIPQNLSQPSWKLVSQTRISSHSRLSNANHACVTKNLLRAEWTRDERGLHAVQYEAAGLRANGTWDDESVTTLNNLKAQAKSTGVQVKIASLLTLCGIKYWECSSDQWKYKGRIVDRGYLIKDQSNQIVLFEDIATSRQG